MGRLRAAFLHGDRIIPGMSALNDEWLEVESLDLDGQGVAHRADGKVVFIEGALPGVEQGEDVAESLLVLTEG